MSIAERRIAGACLPPVVIEHVVDDPDSIRALARANGPYYQPGRQRVPPGLVWPSWRADWAANGEVLLDAAGPLLHHPGFTAAAAEMCGSDHVVPTGICVNLTTPSGGQPVSHTDMPEFHGVDRHQAPSWFLQAMGASGLFEEVRVNSVTAVSWFFAGERGFFRYWPEGRDNTSVRHEVMWNTAVVGDNDFMHHKVERTGAAGAKAPAEMTIDTSLHWEGDEWLVIEDGRPLARYREEEVRLSLSWRAHVLEARSGAVTITLDEVYARMAEEMGNAFAASSKDEMFSDAARKQLVARWPGFRPD